MTKEILTNLVALVRFSFLIVGGYTLWQQDWLGVFVIGQAILISYIPNILHRHYQIYTPFGLRVGIVFFMCFTVVLGEIVNFYDTFWWWDIVLHFSSSAAITLIAFISMLVVYKQKELRATPFFTSVLAVSFSLAVAVFWEIYEFFVDYFLSTDSPMQPSNEDTMTDLIVAVAGALLVGVFGYRYLKNRTINMVTKIIHDGAQHNKI